MDFAHIDSIQNLWEHLVCKTLGHNDSDHQGKPQGTITDRNPASANISRWWQDSSHPTTWVTLRCHRLRQIRFDYDVSHLICCIGFGSGAPTQERFDQNLALLADCLPTQSAQPQQSLPLPSAMTVTQNAVKRHSRSLSGSSSKEVSSTGNSITDEPQWPQWTQSPPSDGRLIMTLLCTRSLMVLFITSLSLVSACRPAFILFIIMFLLVPLPCIVFFLTVWVITPETALLLHV